MRLQFEHVCSADVDDVFRFFADPAGLAVMHRDRPEFRLLRHSGNVTCDSQTWVLLNCFGCIPVVMGFRHVLCQPPLRFSEDLIHGPFRRFTHTHEFEPHAGGTLIRDVIDIEWPWQYGGSFVLRTLVAPLISQMFAWRKTVIDDLIRERVIGSPANPALPHQRT